MATQPTAFGVLLKHFRVRAYLTQAKLAEHAGLSVDAIIKLEHGKRQAPRCDTVLILGRALGLTAQDQHVLQDAARPPARLCDLVPKFCANGQKAGVIGRVVVVEQGRQ